MGSLDFFLHILDILHVGFKGLAIYDVGKALNRSG